VVDGLRAAALGAYGNTTFPTPALDQFAAESYLLDFAFADSTDLPAIYRALWQSQHPLRPAARGESAPSLARLLSDRGYHTTLVTDDAEIGTLGAAAGFHECVQLDGTASARADDVSQTCVTRPLAACCAALRPPTAERESLKQPRFVWMHSRGMFGPWDAPLAFQEMLLDREEGDPAPYAGIEPPEFLLADANDPDAVYAISCAYAAQVMVLDDCVKVVRRCLIDLPSEERWLAVLVGSRGFALGEHGGVGGGKGQLFAEMLQVPMLWRFPDGTGALGRSQRLVSHLDLLPTLLDWIGNGSAKPEPTMDGQSLLPQMRSTTASSRDALLTANATGALAIRTDDWSLRREPVRPDAEDASVELFVRPDDRFEANDVASLCPEVVERLSAVLDTESGRLAHGEEMLAFTTPISR
jgi:arylsulfatase A-like enzyme